MRLAGRRWRAAGAAAAGAGGQVGGGAGGFDPLSQIPWPLIIIALLAFYFPHDQAPTQGTGPPRALLASLKKNDRVLTAGGVYGVITNVHREANEVTVKVDEATNTKLRMTLDSPSRCWETRSRKTRSRNNPSCAGEARYSHP